MPGIGGKWQRINAISTDLIVTPGPSHISLGLHLCSCCQIGCTHHHLHQLGLHKLRLDCRKSMWLMEIRTALLSSSSQPSNISVGLDVLVDWAVVHYLRLCWHWVKWINNDTQDVSEKEMQSNNNTVMEWNWSTELIVCLLDKTGTAQTLNRCFKWWDWFWIGCKAMCHQSKFMNVKWGVHCLRWDFVHAKEYVSSDGAKPNTWCREEDPQVVTRNLLHETETSYFQGCD